VEVPVVAEQPVEAVLPTHRGDRSVKNHAPLCVSVTRARSRQNPEPFTFLMRGHEMR
jgi:hypothetical protein